MQSVHFLLSEVLKQFSQKRQKVGNSNFKYKILNGVGFVGKEAPIYGLTQPPLVRDTSPFKYINLQNLHDRTSIVRMKKQG